MSTYWPDDGGSKHLWNVVELLPDYTAQQPKRQPSSSSTLFMNTANRPILDRPTFVKLVATSLYKVSKMNFWLGGLSVRPHVLFPKLLIGFRLNLTLGDRMSWSSGYHFCFIYGTSRVQISARRPVIPTEVLYVFSQYLQANERIVP
jgi:hypothetical protein